MTTAHLPPSPPTLEAQALLLVFMQFLVLYFTLLTLQIVFYPDLWHWEDFNFVISRYACTRYAPIRSDQLHFGWQLPHRLCCIFNFIIRKDVLDMIQYGSVYWISVSNHQTDPAALIGYMLYEILKLKRKQPP